MPNTRLRQSVKPQRSPKGLFIVVTVVIAVVVLGAFFFLNPQKEQPAQRNGKPATSFNKQHYSLSDPASPWLVVNKKRPLSPLTYEPANLRAPDMALAAAATNPSMQMNAEAAEALEKLNTAAQQAGIELVVVSAYRSYDVQKRVYDSEVRGFGKAQADRESARPGHSEHQTGWAVDLGAANGECQIEPCFGDTPEGQWLAQNAHTYGFIIRYTKDKEPITGYQHEPWHLRYVGTELAAELHRTSTKTLEEFFGLPAAPNY
jgi:zinc D-Ala-D-Ala carboxypeptidase